MLMHLDLDFFELIYIFLNFDQFTVNLVGENFEVNLILLQFCLIHLNSSEKIVLAC